VKLLLENGANANLADIKNRNSVELAVAHGKVEVVKLLLKEKNVHINDKGNDGFSLLHIAAQAGNLNIVTYLINQGADVNSQNDAGSKPIHIATREGHKDIVEFFIKFRSLNNYIDAFSQSLLHYAVLGGQTEILQLLIDLEFDVNVTDRNDCKPIHVAAISGDKNALEILLQHGAYYNATYKDMTPLQLAAENNYLSCVQLLMLIKELFNAVKHNNLSEIEKCISEGVILNVKSTDNVTPLHYACWKGYQDIVNILLKNKADPNGIGKDGSSPLHYAAKFNHFAIVRHHYLLFCYYQTPLDLSKDQSITNLLTLTDELFKASENNGEVIVQKVSKLSNNEIVAIVNARNIKGNTLLENAIFYQPPEILRSFLLEQRIIL
ncbi:hypothetical protein NPIL_166011, partial [Nephila pilipes]